MLVRRYDSAIQPLNLYCLSNKDALRLFLQGDNCALRGRNGARRKECKSTENATRRIKDGG